MKLQINKQLIVLPILFIANICLADFTGKVVGISDGDTFKILKEGREVKVRLFGIDAPEKNQAFGQKAKTFASDLSFGKLVNVKESGSDRYGRTIGEIFLQDGTSVNEKLVQNGFAWWYQKYAPNDKRFELLEQSARANKLGLWSHPNPLPPWEFRKGKKANKAKEKPLPKPFIRCQATTKKGTQCKRKAKSNGYCWQHQDG